MDSGEDVLYLWESSGTILCPFKSRLSRPDFTSQIRDVFERRIRPLHAAVEALPSWLTFTGYMVLCFGIVGLWSAGWDQLVHWGRLRSDSARIAYCGAWFILLIVAFTSPLWAKRSRFNINLYTAVRLKVEQNQLVANAVYVVLAIGCLKCL